MNRLIRIILTILILVTCFVLQGTLFYRISFNGVVPNLLLVVTVSLGLMRGRIPGMLVGFFAGLLLDVFMGTTIGFHAIIYMYIGYANGYFHRIFFPEDIKLPIGMIIFSDLIYGIVCYALQFLLKGKLDFKYYFAHIIIPEMIYTILITVVLYPAIFIINRALERREMRRERKFV